METKKPNKFENIIGNIPIIIIILMVLSLCLPCFLGNEKSSTKNETPFITSTNEQYIKEEDTYPECASCSKGYTTCRISHAYCTYKPNIKNKPTFCNDAPYPKQNFTLLVWNKDWSYLDGECLIVTGNVYIYKGKPEIEVSDISQVSICK